RADARRASRPGLRRAVIRFVRYGRTCHYVPVAASLSARLARLRVDLTPWRGSRDFRILLVAGSVFFLGGMVGYVALPYQLYQLTGSNFAVGAMGLVTIVPLVVFGLYGGALA